MSFPKYLMMWTAGTRFMIICWYRASYVYFYLATGEIIILYYSDFLARGTQIEGRLRNLARRSDAGVSSTQYSNSYADQFNQPNST